MHLAERRMKIFDMIKKEKHVNVATLAQDFQVSKMTIRRDLAVLEKQGVITTSYGGATFNEGVSSEPSFHLKSGLSQEYKEQIAYEASFLVQDGDSIYIDCGTTPLELIKYIVDKKITIITNSWRVLSKIHDFSKVKVILAPGEYDPISEGALSLSTIDFMHHYTIDKAFISTQGVDLQLGISVPTDNDAQVKKAITSCAKYKILLADHTKFNQTFFAKHGSLNDFDIIITDIGIDSSLLAQMKEMNLNVVVSQSLLNKQKYR